MMRVIAFLVLNAAAAVILSAVLMPRGGDDDGGQKVHGGDLPDAPPLNGSGGTRVDLRDLGHRERGGVR